MRGTRVAAILAAMLVLQFVGGLAFRAFIYADMYIAPDAPYGISDIVEFVLGILLLATGALVVLTAVVLAVRGPKSNRKVAALLVALVLLLGGSLEPAHQAAAKWSVRQNKSAIAPAAEVTPNPSLKRGLSTAGRLGRAALTVYHAPRGQVVPPRPAA